MQPDVRDLERLRVVFARHLGRPGPSHVVRAPGRVNLIGEHIDYNGLAVLPMAIQRNIVVLFRANADATVRVANANDAFPPREFTLSASIPPFAAGDWGNYLKAAVQALAAECDARIGIDAVVGSTLPIAAGVSSSSALVIAVALALARVNDLEIPALDLAERMAHAEHYVGTHGGAMDQAICLMAQPGTASRIDFDPLRATPVPIPDHWRFIIAHSLAQAEKSGAARDEYNRRTRQCRRALERVSAHLGIAPSRATYRTVIAARPVAQLLGAAESCLDGTLLKRFRHVVTEADRVHRAERALRDADLDRFGRLVQESQASLRDDYEVSTRALDEIAEIAGAAGAVGARLTGAGMGGCAIALARSETVDGVVDALVKRFYGPRDFSGSVEDHLFISEPAGGASVTSVS